MRTRGRSSLTSLFALRSFGPKRKRPSGRWCPQRAASSVARLNPASLPPGAPAGEPRASALDDVFGCAALGVGTRLF